MHSGMDKFIEKALHGDGDSDRHFITLYAIALASRGKNYIELGVHLGIFGGARCTRVDAGACINGSVLQRRFVRARVRGDRNARGHGAVLGGRQRLERVQHPARRRFDRHLDRAV